MYIRRNGVERSGRHVRYSSYTIDVTISQKECQISEGARHQESQILACPSSPQSQSLCQVRLHPRPRVLAIVLGTTIIFAQLESAAWHEVGSSSESAIHGLLSDKEDPLQRPLQKLLEVTLQRSKSIMCCTSVPGPGRWPHGARSSLMPQSLRVILPETTHFAARRAAHEPCR